MAVFMSGSIILPNRVHYVEYIQSSGTQYIDTGFKPNNNTRVLIKMQMDTPSNHQAVFGARTANANGAFNLYALYDQKVYRSDYGAVQAKLTVGPGSTPQIIDMDKTTVKVDDVTLATHAASTFQTSCPISIFANNTGGTPEASTYAVYKLYWMKVYDDGNLVRDYVPCYDDDGVACLYDQVNKEYVYNAGTGTFIAGGVS